MAFNQGSSCQWNIRQHRTKPDSTGPSRVQLNPRQQTAKVACLTPANAAAAPQKGCAGRRCAQRQLTRPGLDDCLRLSGEHRQLTNADQNSQVSCIMPSVSEAAVRDTASGALIHNLKAKGGQLNQNNSVVAVWNVSLALQTQSQAA